jgi:sugar/nucleoside kinase (ribokinase family)
MMTKSHSESKLPIVACLGEVLIDFIAEQTGTLDSVHSFRRYPGGAPANVAVGIARLGVPSGFIGKVGADTFGEFLISMLKENGVHTGGITQTEEAPTALAFVSRPSSGDRDFLFYREPCADILLTGSELPKNWLSQIQYLHLGGVSLTRNPSRQATLQAAKLTQANGGKITFDPNLRIDLWTKGLTECRSITQAILEFTDIFLPSKEELLILMGTDNLNKAIIRAHEMGPPIICVKMGSRGSMISERNQRGEFRKFTQPPFTVDVVDTTGAGDGYDPGLIVGLVQGLSLEEAVRQGTAVASLVITKMGAMTALPTTTELGGFLELSP